MKTEWTDSKNACRSLAASVVAIIALQVTTLHAAQWFVDGKRGNDQKGTGSLAAPWKTIQKAATTMAAGDVCHIREGTYREMVTPKSGQTFRNYNEEFVLISGCDVAPAEGWKQHAGNIYKATVSSPVYDVFVEGEYMDKAAGRILMAIHTSRPIGRPPPMPAGAK